MMLHPSILQSAKRLVYFLPIPGVVAAVTYLVTLSKEVYPGLSSALTAEAAGLIPPAEAAHPLFALVARGVASLDLFSLPVRLNLLSACCGTLCAMLLYHVVSRLILFSACEDPGGAGRAYRDEEVEGNWMPPEVNTYNQGMFPFALGGGLIAALLFIFLVPVWSAATRLDKGLFDLLLALVAMSLIPVKETPYRWLMLAFSAFLFTLGLFDSAVFLLLLPCYAFFLFKEFMLSERRGNLISCFIVAGLLGSAIAVYAYAQNSATARGLNLLPLLSSYAHALPISHYRELLSFFPRSGWGLILVQTGLPALTLLFMRQRLFKDKRAHTVLALLLVAGAAVPGLLNLSASPFSLFQPINHLPVFGAAMLAATTAMVLMSLMIFFNTDDTPQHQTEKTIEGEAEPVRPPLLLRGIVGLLLPSLTLLVLAVPFWSFHKMNVRGVFADEVARAMLDQMKGRTWLISNGYLDNHLLVQAQERKQPLTLVTLRPQEQPKETARLKRLIEVSPDFEGLNRQRLLNALSLGSVRFVREWFITDPDAGRRAMVFATPDLWISCGYVALPEGLAFGGIRSGQKPDMTKLAEANKAFSGRLLPRLQMKQEASGFAAFLSDALRIKAGLAANELGVLLEEEGKQEAAYQAYLRASEIDPKNMSAVFNGYSLAIAQKMNPKEINRLNKKITAMTAGRNYQSREITWILQNYGTIRQPAFYHQQAKMWASRGVRSVAADKLRKTLGLSEQTGIKALIDNAMVYVQSGDPEKAEACYLTALEKDPQNQSALSGMSLLTLSQKKIPETRQWMQKALDAGVGKDTLIYPSITLAILENDIPQALKLLEEATQKFPTDPRYWTMKADILLGRGDTLLVEKSVLPQMQEALKSPDHVLIHSVRGFLLKKKGPAFYVEARLSLLRALSLNAAMPELWSTLFELDLAMNKPDLLEKDAKQLLNIDPEHVLANYLLGSLLLSRGKLLESEDFLRRSLEHKATSATCNDLAENLRRQGKLAEAESVVRRALVLEPNLLPAMDTLACVLYDGGKHEEAEQQAIQAVTAQPKHPAYQLTLLRIQLKQSDPKGVMERVLALKELKTEIPPELTKEIEALKKQR